MAYPSLLTSACSQILSCVERAVTMVGVHLGLGKHITEIDPANLPGLHTFSRVASSFAILACALAKTSWALTMLKIVRSSRDCMRIMVWFLLVSVNVLMDAGIILNFLECDGTGLTISPSEMWCWSNLIAANYNLFSAGKWLSVTGLAKLEQIASTDLDSLVWSYGHCSRLTSLENYLAYANEN